MSLPRCRYRPVSLPDPSRCRYAFHDDGYGGYRQEQDPLGRWTLAGNWTDGFTLTSGDGTREEFNAGGMRTAVLDRNGNRTGTESGTGSILDG